ncbi:hypothetical protein CVT26_011771 [Gymnopilus dilepis]|uniref:NAD-dependent epimerase/dehydratase domain-containing protein n=1 Tax=Gymnopilus dilepis TaxID=231916 RepID=A0A409W8Z8_9AGAR|nr:hypothetical protein CVT26_011771 [Gymnopilus dilepis]
MRVFLTGGSGFIGSAIIPELLQAGHQVLALARSDAAAAKLQSAGADVLRGSLDDLDSLKRGAAESDGVIHCAFIHDFSDFHASIQTDRVAIETLGAALEGTNRPFIITSGTLGLARSSGSGSGSEEITEKDVGDPNSPLSARNVTEDYVVGLAAKGVRSAVIRLPPSVHGKGDHGFIPALIDVARKQGVSAYIGDGTNRWPSAHRLDVARLYRLVLELGKAGARYHGVSGHLTPVREIAEVIGRQLGVSVVSKTQAEAPGHFGFLGLVLGIDNPVSSKHTQEELGWKPSQAPLLLDIAENYF